MKAASGWLIRHARVVLPNGEWMVGDVQTRQGEIVQDAPGLLKAPADLYRSGNHRRTRADFVAGSD